MTSPHPLTGVGTAGTSPRTEELIALAKLHRPSAKDERVVGEIPVDCVDRQRLLDHPLVRLDGQEGPCEKGVRRTVRVDEVGGVFHLGSFFGGDVLTLLNDTVIQGSPA